MKSERGGLGQGLAVFLVLVVLAMGTCLWIADDDDHEDGMAPSRRERSGQGDDRSSGRESRGDCEGSDQCSDDDFSPTLTDSPVIICLPSSRCDFGENESAALFPPSPERLVEVITAFGQNVGTAAGALAGAIAGGTAGILL